MGNIVTRDSKANLNLNPTQANPSQPKPLLTEEDVRSNFIGKTRFVSYVLSMINPSNECKSLLERLGQSNKGEELDVTVPLHIREFCNLDPAKVEKYAKDEIRALIEKLETKSNDSLIEKVGARKAKRFFTEANEAIDELEEKQKMKESDDALIEGLRAKLPGFSIHDTITVADVVHTMLDMRVTKEGNQWEYYVKKTPMKKNVPKMLSLRLYGSKWVKEDLLLELLRQQIMGQLRNQHSALKYRHKAGQDQKEFNASTEMHEITSAFPKKEALKGFADFLKLVQQIMGQLSNLHSALKYPYEAGQDQKEFNASTKVDEITSAFPTKKALKGFADFLEIRRSYIVGAAATCPDDKWIMEYWKGLYPWVQEMYGSLQNFESDVLAQKKKNSKENI